eukprot:11894460-Prorocentrum_lima.AAC.1
MALYGSPSNCESSEGFQSGWKVLLLDADGGGSTNFPSTPIHLHCRPILEGVKVELPSLPSGSQSA